LICSSGFLLFVPPSLLPIGIGALFRAIFAAAALPKESFTRRSDAYLETLFAIFHDQVRNRAKEGRLR
jgi:hypothetical protein